MRKDIILLFAALLVTTPVIADQPDAAKVNGVVISNRDLAIEVDRLLPSISYHGNVTDERRSELREQALENLIDRELQYQDAFARGLKADPGTVSARLEQVKNSFGTSKEYKAALSEAGITEKQLEERFRKEALISVAVEKTVIEPAKIDDASLREYYEKNRDKFRQPESIRLRIISTKNEKKAAELSARLKAGEDFGTVAATGSEDKYRVKGGDIGIIHRGSIYPELENAAFSMKPGQVSDIIRAEGIWFILRVEERTPEHQVSFEQIKDKLRSELQTKRASALMDQWISSLKTKAKIERFQPASRM